MSDVKHLVFALDTFERVDTGTRERQALPKFTHCICKANVCAKVPSFVKGFVVGGKKKEQSTLVLKELGLLVPTFLRSANEERTERDGRRRTNLIFLPDRSLIP